MPIVRLRPPLRELAEGRREVTVEGGTVVDVLRELERSHPKLGGWILDDRGQVRQHVAVFLEGERVDGDARVTTEDRLEVIGAVSGGAATELLVGTRKGLFVLRGEREGEMDVVARAFPGSSVEFAIRDPRTGRYFASVTHGQFGPRVYLADDPTGAWDQAEGPRFPEDTDTTLVRTWVITPGERDGVLYAGVDPAALFESRDDGMTWELNRGLWDQPSRPDWGPGAGGLCLHSICPWPGEPDRLAVGISSVGVWVTEDGGASWEIGNAGIVPRYLPEEARATEPLARCVHNMHRSPTRPERLFMQFHGGVYRSDDAARSWTSIAQGLPSDFGFPMVVDPNDPDCRVRDPAQLRSRPRLGRGSPPGVRDARRRLELDRPHRGTPAGRHLPHDPAPGVRPRRSDAARPVVRRDVGSSCSGHRMPGRRGAWWLAISHPCSRSAPPEAFAGSSPRGRPGTAPSGSGGSSVVLFVLVVGGRPRSRPPSRSPPAPSAPWPSSATVTTVPSGGSQSHSPGTWASRSRPAPRWAASCAGRRGRHTVRTSIASPTTSSTRSASQVSTSGWVNGRRRLVCSN